MLLKQQHNGPGGQELYLHWECGEIGLDVVCDEHCFLLDAGFLRRLCNCYRKQIHRKRRVKLATRKITIQFIMRYILVVFMVGLNVPYNDKNLRDASISSIRQGQNSNLIIACIRSGVLSLLHFFQCLLYLCFFDGRRRPSTAYIYTRDYCMHLQVIETIG